MNTMSLNHNFLVLIQNFCTWSLLQSSLCFSSMLFMIFLYVTIHNEGVYISFLSCALKLSNIHIQFYLLALTTINVFYLLRMRASCSRSIYIIQVRLHLATSLMLQKVFKICVGCFSNCLLPSHWLA